MFQLSLLSIFPFCWKFLGLTAPSLAIEPSLGDPLTQPDQQVEQIGAKGIIAIKATFQQVIHAVADILQSLWLQASQLFEASIQQLQSWGESVALVVLAPTLWQVGLYWVLLGVMVVGFIGSFVPILPGVALVLLAVIIWGVATGFSGILWSVGVAIAAFLLSIAVDNLAGLIGAQKAGASRWGQIGALAGMVVGFLVLTTTIPVVGPVLGIILGTMLGAMVGEFWHRRDLEFRPRAQQSFKVGIAILVGSLVGNLLQGMLALIAIVVFILDTWPTVYG
ncbi:MAG: DUF456 family protein [Leptolyngbyaceae bacterium]|nr:DUF456 family protein [Leptolyngbyaceae bacterium]